VDDALIVAAMDGRGPAHVRLVGVVALDLADGPGLSTDVEDAIPAACDAVLAELRALGYSAAPRVVVGQDAAWWRRFATVG
jgi:hypothetical protein